MKKALLILSFAVCFNLSRAQYYDRAWLLGGANTMAKLTFDGNSYDTSSYFWGAAYVWPGGAMSNVSDTLGNILFYCNGVQVANSLTQVMENGDTLTDSLFYSMFSDDGFSESQTNLILPRSGNTFYLFYYSESDSLLSLNIDEPDELYYAVIDMDSDGGLGKVVSKKNLLYKGLFGDSRLTACRHANGRDWWMVNQGEGNNEYLIYLVTPDSVYGPQIQYIGPSGFYNDDVGSQSCFSPDGSKFATVSMLGPLVFMDFDRCTGTLFNPDSISIPIDTTFRYDSGVHYFLGGGSSACVFSPSGRFLYTTDGAIIIQYDTRAADVMASAIIVGMWDSLGPVAGFSGFYQMSNLPNGQIIVDNGGHSAFELIDSPDVQGGGCAFRFEGLPTSALNTNCMPNMINYQLGALPAGCDTLGVNTISAQNIRVKVYPNPASDAVQVDVSNRDMTEPISFVLYDMLGQEIIRQNIPLYQIQINRDNTAAGIYTWQIQNSTGQVIANGKMVWE